MVTSFLIDPSTKIRAKSPEALVVKPGQACILLNCGRTRLYELLAAGELDSFRDGRARKITVASIHGYIERRLAAEKDALERTDMAVRDRR